jgi:hypothetical protein
MGGALDSVGQRPAATWCPVYHDILAMGHRGGYLATTKVTSDPGRAAPTHNGIATIAPSSDGLPCAMTLDMTKMTKGAQVRVAFATAELISLVARGWEYPDAHSRVCASHRLDSAGADAVAAAYDEAILNTDSDV